MFPFKAIVPPVADRVTDPAFDSPVVAKSPFRETLPFVEVSDKPPSPVVVAPTVTAAALTDKALRFAREALERSLAAVPEVIVIPSSQAVALERVPLFAMSVTIVMAPSEEPSESKVMVPPFEE